MSPAPAAIALTIGQETMDTDQSIEALKRMVALIEELQGIGMTATIRGNLYVDLKYAVPEPQPVEDVHH